MPCEKKQLESCGTRGQDAALNQEVKVDLLEEVNSDQGFEGESQLKDQLAEE